MKKNFIFSLMLAIISGIVIFGCKKDRTVIIVNQSTTAGSLNVLSQFASTAPQKQTFTLNAASGGWISGIKGCNFYFQPNSLLDAANLPVTGTVDIELIEYMNKADMLFSGVTVPADGQLLESGGMFYLMAKKGGVELKMKNNGLTAVIPQTNNTPDPMNIWNGVPNTGDALNKINWKKADTVAVKAQKDTAKFNYFLNFNYFKFGYCNIDREWCKFKTFIHKFHIKMPKGCADSNSTALLLFKNYNCCAWCGWDGTSGDITTHYQLPLGETIKVLAYKKTGKGADDLEYSLQEITLVDDTEITFSSLTPCTEKQLEDMIKAL